MGMFISHPAGVKVQKLGPGRRKYDCDLRVRNIIKVKDLPVERSAESHVRRGRTEKVLAALVESTLMFPAPHTHLLRHYDPTHMHRVSHGSRGQTSLSECIRYICQQYHRLRSPRVW